MSGPHILDTLTRAQGNNRALIDGAVSPTGFMCAFAEVPVLVHGFRRMVRDLEFDVSEMALTTYLTAREHGVRFTALPIFLVRGFHHGAILYNTRSGIHEPADLEGRRVGVNRGYTVTTGVWARGILESEYGVDPDAVTWVPSGDEHVASYTPPRNVQAAPPGSDLSAMLIAGELDAVIGAEIDHPDVVPLIPDAETAALTALEQRAFYPINHLIVVKDEVLQRYPDVAVAMFEAFAEAKQRYVQALRTGSIERLTTTDQMYTQVLETTGADPLPYGIDSNRAMLTTLVDFALRQRILRHPVDIEDLFAKTTLTLTA
ncbi:ABC transporter substrate-binding protein [soil metagenome]